MNTQRANLMGILRHIKLLAQTHQNKAQLAELADIKYYKVQNFCKTEEGMLWPEDLQKLADYFGIEIYADIVPVQLDWLPHPANAAYEYEVDTLSRPTGKIRLTSTKVIVAPAPQAAE